MTYRIVPCPKCNRLHGVVAVPRRTSPRRRPVTPLRDGGSPLAESPRDGVERFAVGDLAVHDPASTSSQAASPRPLVRGTS